MRTSRGLVCAAALVACAMPVPSALGAVKGRVYSIASGPGSTTKTDISTAFSLEARTDGFIGGHGYARIDYDFAGGQVAGRNHACVGPPASAPSGDTARGECGLINSTNETLTVTSDTLPLGTPVQIMFCINMSATISGTITEPGADVSGDAFTATSFSVNGFGIAGSLYSDTNSWDGLEGGGLYDGMDNDETVSATAMYTLTRNVGETFTIRIDANSVSRAHAKASPTSFPISDGSAGFAMTFGISSITAGAQATWNGSPWVGSCAPSLPLIPDNPVPAPASTLFVLAAMPALAHRRR